MIELPVTLTSTGGAVSFASPVTLGYTKNKGMYRLLITAEGEWQGLTIRCFWHLPGGTDPASSLVQDGFVDVPASVTAQPGTGCITFEGSDGEKTVTSADLRYKVGSNSGTEDGTMPEPGTPAWEQLVSETKANADAAEQAKNDAQAAAEGVKTAAAKADEAAQKAEGAAQRAEAAQKATEQAEAAAAESIAGAKKEALSAISTGEQGALGAVQQAQTTATEAVQAAQTAAESAVNAAKTNAVQEVEAAAKPAQTAAAKAEEAAELSTQAGIAASNAADDAKRSAGIATGAAGDSALNAENAQKSALSAQQSAENAAESQSAAQASADAAEKSQQSAATDAKTANDAKTAAAGSADDAAGSAVAAGNSASAAAGSEQAAGASKVKAAESEKAAKASEQDAAKSAQAALESKTAAATSEGNAAASAKKAQDVADSLPADYMTAVNEIAALKTNKADKTELETVKQQVANITPDDSSIGDKPWSSKHIIDMLCPPLEGSGNPVVCYPVAGYTLGVKAKWEPIQEGTGTPSPENIRPIKGRDSVTVERCGENLLHIKPFNKDTYKGITYEYVPDGGIHISGTALASVDSPIFLVWHLPPGKYYGINMGTCIAASIVVRRNGADLWLNAKGVFEILAGDVLKYWYMIVNNGSTLDTTIYPYIVPGTTAPATYTPYIGQTATLTLPETVYGGEVDAVSGEGIKNWKRVVFDGTERWNARTANYTSYNLVLPMRSQTGFCTHFKKLLYDAIRPDTGTGETGCYLESSASAIFNVPFENVDDWKNYLVAQYAAGTPVYIVYQYANKTNEPFAATGAQPIPALAGANTVLTDADSATVTGRADPIKRIADLENKE